MQGNMDTIQSFYTLKEYRKNHLAVLNKKDIKMDFVDKQDVLDRGDCIEVAKSLLGLKVEDDRCAATWRNGTNPKSVALTKDGWYDHSKKEGGSVIDLVMKVRNCNFVDSLEELAKFYNIERKLKIAEGRKKIKEFTYNDAQGNPLHKSVRYQLADGEKDFIQYRFENNDWCLGLGNIETVPYHLDKIKDFDTLFIHEGEGKCDCAIEHGITNSTCFCLGSGKWFPYWGAYFKDKDVIIVRDNDDAGYAHGARLAWELKTIAKSIKLITPSKITKGDCYEYFNEEGGTKDSFLQLTNATPALDIREIHEPKEAKEDKQEIDAKTLNKTAFKNYTSEETGKKQKNGKMEKIYFARTAKELVQELSIRLLQFPKKCGGKLFDVDKKTGKHKEINDSNDLLGWIALKTGHNPIFKELNGFITSKMLFSILHREVEEFELISDMPHYPPIENVYYLKKDMPDPTPDYHYFNEFCQFFHGETYEDSLLIKICIASMFYYEYKVDKPMWIMDVAPGAGQGVGKTKAVELMAYLLNSEPFWISPNLFKVNDITTQLNRRMLSMDGRRKRIFLIDNVETFFKSPELASYITQGSFSGMAPYGKGETSRINDLNFFITSNKGTFDTDIIIRSFIVYFNYRKKRDDNWITTIKSYIKAHRFQIASEIIHILKTNTFRCKPQTRFTVWEQNVLMPIVGTQANFDAVIKIIKERGATSDGELERAEILNDFIYNKLRDLPFFHPITSESIDPDKDYIFIESYVLMKWALEAIPNMGGKGGGNVMHVLRQMANSNPKFILCGAVEKWPMGKNVTGQKRGMMWRGRNFLLENNKMTEDGQKEFSGKVIILSIGSERTPDGKTYATVIGKLWANIQREAEEKEKRNK
jgi:hypothetical protein